MNFIFLYIGNFIIPTDELIVFRGVEHPFFFEEPKEKPGKLVVTSIGRI